MATDSTLTHDRPNQRHEDRIAVSLALQASVDGYARLVHVRDISHTGFLAESEPPLEVGQTVELELPYGEPKKARVVWAGEALAGCNFTGSISRAAYSAALLKSRLLHPRGVSDKDVGQPLMREGPDKLPLWLRLVVLAVIVAVCWLPILAYAILH